jgi:hypothetical protein
MVHQGSEPGKFLGYFTIPKWYEGGEWRLMRIALTDDAATPPTFLEERRGAANAPSSGSQ